MVARLPALARPEFGVDVAPMPPTVYDDEFDGSTFNSSLWTWENQGTALVAITKSRAQFTYSASASNVQAIYQTAPTSTYQITAGSFFISGNAAGGDTGLFLMDGSGKIIVFGQLQNGGGVTNQSILVGYWTNATTFSSNPVLTTCPFTQARYLQITDNGTNYIFSASADGTYFWPVLTVSRTAFLSGTGIKMGIFIGYGASVGLSVDWFRRTA